MTHGRVTAPQMEDKVQSYDVGPLIYSYFRDSLKLDNLTPASSGESMLLAAQALPTSSPINVLSTASVVPAPTASQFSRELEDIRVAEVLISMREGQSAWSNTTHRSHTLDTIPETQDLDVDLEVMLLHVCVSVGHLPYDDIFDPNATTLPMHSMPGIDSPVIGLQTAGTGYISPVFGIPSQTASGWGRAHTHTHIQPDTLQ